MNEKELIDLVYSLNCMLPEEITLERGDCSFQLQSSGWSISISIGGIYLWDSDNDERPWDEEKDDYAISVKDYIIQEFNKIVALLNKVELRETELKDVED